MMTIDESGRPTACEMWHVELPDGVRMMSGEELAAAFRSGLVTPETMVLRSDAFHWGTAASTIPGIGPSLANETQHYHSSIPPMATDIAAALPPMPRASVDFSFGMAERSDAAELRTRRAIFGALLTCAIVALFFAAYGTGGIGAKLASLAGRHAQAASAPAAAAPPPPAPPEPPPPAAEPPKPVPAPPATGVAKDDAPDDKTAAKKHGKSKKPKKPRP